MFNCQSARSKAFTSACLHVIHCGIELRSACSTSEKYGNITDLKFAVCLLSCYDQSNMHIDMYSICMRITFICRASKMKRFRENQQATRNHNSNFGVCIQFTDAAIAQLGERQTEDLKVPGSIPGLGNILPEIPLSFWINSSSILTHWGS